MERGRQIKWGKGMEGEREGKRGYREEMRGKRERSIEERRKSREELLAWRTVLAYGRPQASSWPAKLREGEGVLRDATVACYQFFSP